MQLYTIGKRVQVKLLGRAHVEFENARFLMHKSHYQLRLMIAQGMDKTLRDLVSICDKQTLIIDIGANIGVYSLIACAQTGARAFCFEPIPSTFADLVMNLNLNDGINITPFNVAISNSNGFVKMVAERASGINHITANAPRGLPIRDVPSLTLDQIYALLPIGSAQKIVIKIDVERHEVSVINGGIRAFLRQDDVPIAVCVEFSTDNEADIEKLMNQVGFARCVNMGDSENAFFMNSAWNAKVMQTLRSTYLTPR